MKKLIISVVLAIVLTLAVATAAFAHSSVTNPNHCQDLANGQTPGDPATHGLHTARDASGVVSGSPC